MDLSKLSDEDLLALSKGDVKSLSDGGLYVLAGMEPPEQKSVGADLLKGAAAPLVGAFDLAAGIPKFAAGTAAALATGAYKTLKGEDVNLGDERKNWQEAIEETYPQIAPQFDLDKYAGHKAINYPFQKLGEGVDYLGDKTTELTGNEKLGGAVKLGADLAMLGGGIPGARLAKKAGTKVLDKFIKVDPDALRAEKGYGDADFEAAMAKRQTGPKPSETYSRMAEAVQGDLFQGTPEEIIQKQREQAQAEAEAILRDANGPQGDLFAGMGERAEGEKPTSLSIEDGGLSARNRPDRMIGEVEEQAKLAMQDVEGLREGEQVRAGTYPEQVPDNIMNWQHPKDIDVERAWEEKNAAEQADQQSAKETAWQRAEAEQAPLDLEPSQRSVEIEKPGERTTYRPNSNKPLGQTGFGKSQRGSIGWQGKDPFDEYVERLKKQYGDVDIEAAREAWDAKQKKQTGLNLSVKQDQAVGKIAGLDKLVNNFKNDDRPWREVKPEIEGTPDISGSIFSKLSQRLVAGGKLFGELTNSPFIRKGVAFIDGAKTRAEAQWTRVLDGRDGIKSHIAKLSDEASRGRVMSLFKEGEGKGYFSDQELLQRGYKPHEVKAYQKIVKELTDFWNKVNEQRVANGLQEIPARPGYFPSYFLGKWFFTAKTPDGAMWRPSSNFKGLFGKFGLSDTLEQMKKDHPDWEFSEVQEAPNPREMQGDFAEAMKVITDMMDSDKPGTQFIKAEFERIKNMAVTNQLGFKSRTKSKSGWRGHEGDKYGEEQKINTKDAEESIFRYFQTGYNYLEMFNTIKEVNKMLEDAPDMGQTNAGKYLQLYFENALGKSNEHIRALEDGIRGVVADVIGVAPALQSKIMRSINKQLSLVMVGYNRFSMLATQYMQPLQVLPPWILYLGDKYGLSTKTAPATFIRTMMDLADREDASTLSKEALGYAEDMHYLDLQFFDHMETVQGGKISKGWSVANGEYWLKRAEHTTRAFTYLNMVHLLERNGLKAGKELFDTAQSLTQMVMTDYRPHEKPLLFQRYGMLGSAFGALKSFGANDLTTLALMGKESKKALAAKLLATATFTGALGFYGSSLASQIQDLLKEQGWIAADSDNVQTAIRKSNLPDVLKYGIFSTVTKSDLTGSFSPQNPFSQGIGVGMFPTISKLGQVASAAGGIASGVLHGGVTDQKWREASTALPGHLKGIAEWSQSKVSKDGKTRMVKDHNGDGLISRPNDPLDGEWVRRYLGTKSLHESELTTAGFDPEKRKKIINQRSMDLLELINEKNESGMDWKKELDEYLALGGNPKTLQQSIRNKTTKQFMDARQRTIGFKFNSTKQKLHAQDALEYQVRDK